jgi:hypothetical protein
MTPFRRIAAAVLVGAAAYLLAWPVVIDPVAWPPAPNPGLTGPFAHGVGFTDPVRVIEDSARARGRPVESTRGAYQAAGRRLFS